MISYHFTRHYSGKHLSCIFLNMSSKLKERAADLFNTMTDPNQPVDVALIADAGVVDACVTTAFGSHFRVFSCPPGPDDWTCAIIVKADIITTGIPRYDPANSGRAIMLDITPTTTKRRKCTRLIVLYQPPDQDSLSSDNPRRTEARRLLGVVNRWSNHRSVEQAVLGMDGNETINGHIDRAVGNHRTPGKYRAQSLPQTMVDDMGWCDLYRYHHPPPDDCIGQSPVDGRLMGHTFFNSMGGSSRIDYAMVKTHLPL